MAKKPAVTWVEEPAEHDYPAAGAFLGLLAHRALSDAVTQMLSLVPTVHHHAKDILRAAGLPLLTAADPQVAKDLKNVAKGRALSPVLLVRGDIRSGRVLTIADGYHRVCASYLLGEDTEIPCRLVDLPPIVDQL